MIKEIDREICYRITSIIMTIVFMLAITWFWYGPRKEFIASSMAMNKTMMNLQFTEETEGINLVDAYPVLDEDGLKVKPYIFNISNLNDKQIKYALTFVNEADNCDNLDNNYLRYTLSINGIESKARNLALDGILVIDTIDSETTNRYELRFWLDGNADNSAMNKCLSSKVYVREI